MGSEDVLQGTVEAYEPFIPEFFDCETLHKSFKKGFVGVDCDTKPLIQLLSSRSSAQRLQLLYYYKKKYDKDLFELLKAALGGDFWRLVSALLKHPADYAAKELNRALKGLSVDHECLNEILFTRNNKELQAISNKYEELFHCKLWQDITQATSGEYRHLLVDSIKGERKESSSYSTEDMAKVVQRLTAEPLMAEKSYLRELLVTESHAQLLAIFRLLESEKEQRLDEMIDSQGAKVQKEYKTALKTFVRIVKDQPEYFAEKLYLSMKGVGTRDKTLMRLVVSRCEIDMVQVKEAFKRKYDQRLDQFIVGDTSGDYRKLLLALIGVTL